MQTLNFDLDLDPIWNSCRFGMLSQYGEHLSQVLVNRNLMGYKAWNGNDLVPGRRPR